MVCKCHLSPLCVSYEYNVIMARSFAVILIYHDLSEYVAGDIARLGHERIEQHTWVCLKIRPPKPMVHHHVPSLSICIYNVCMQCFFFFSGGKISFSETSHYISMWLAIDSISPNFPCMILIYSDKPNNSGETTWLLQSAGRDFFCIPPSAALVRTFAEARSWIHRDRTRKKSGRDLRLLGLQQ